MIRKRGKKWAVEVYDPAIKKRRYIPPAQPTRAEALALERATATAISMGRSSTQTVRDWAGRWLELYPRSATAATNFRYGIKGFVEAYGPRRLDAISRLEARAWAIKNQWRLPAVRAFYNDAIDAEVVHDNPFAKLGLEQSRGRKDLEVISDAALDSLVESATLGLGDYGAHFGPVIYFAAYTAIRPGELFALDWDHLDLDNLEAHVEWQITQKHGRQRPKYDARRHIVVPPPARDAILSMPRFDGPHVFGSVTGRRLSSSSHHDAWSVVAAVAGRPGMDFYELRHYGATKLLELGLTPEEVAVQMGHKDGGDMVRKVYGHPDHAKIRERIKEAWLAEAS